MALNQQLIILIQNQFKSHSELLVGLKEDGNQSFRAVDFCISPLGTPEREEKITILTPRNDPYLITGREKVAYQRKWQELCDIAQEQGFKDPFQYLALHELDDYSINLPTATVILSGFCKYVKEFQERGSPITHVGITAEGPRPLNQPVLTRFTDLTRSFYSGHTAGDIKPELATL